MEETTPRQSKICVTGVHKERRNKMEQRSEGNDGWDFTETDESYSSWRFKKPCEHQVGKTQSKPYLGI